MPIVPDTRSDIQAVATREQADTSHATVRDILASREFARGFAEVRNGTPFNADTDSWEYERGRCLAIIAPLDLPLRIGRRLNPEAVELAEIAFSRKLLI